MLGSDQYLVDILDSAQEACPYMWVNGEKYVFSEHVIQKGISMFATLVDLTRRIPKIQTTGDMEELKKLITSFDVEWCAYEKAYISELIIIENDARRFILALKQSVGNDRAFVEAIGEVNAVANPEGTGRSDFDYKLLSHCKRLKSDSAAVQSLCARVVAAFTNLEKFATTVDVDLIDP